MRYLSTVYVRDHEARVSHRRGTLIVSLPEGKQRIPLNGIDAVVMLGAGQLTSQALDACVRAGGRVSSLARSGKLKWVLGGPVGGNVHLRIAQYEASTDGDHSLAVAKAIVAAKLQNSWRVVDRWARDERDESKKERLRERVASIQSKIEAAFGAVSGDHVRGVEGDGARVYFRALGEVLSEQEITFEARTRRPPRDPANAVMSFCYTMLVTEMVGALQGLGLDHQVGFLHRARSGRPSLALDLAEELRALTDRFVVSLIRRREVNVDSFTTMPGGAVYLSDGGREVVLGAWERHKAGELWHAILGRKVERWALPSIQATLLARHLRGDLLAYPPFVMQ